MEATCVMGCDTPVSMFECITVTSAASICANCTRPE
jgi:hypothetical protein